jgi:peptidoglycan biosynthesis protein MviN/MurJ (putative lipid II flippase)
VAGGASVLLNLALIPRYGIFGAAWANAAAYAVQATLAFRFAQRFYPIDYEWGRLARVTASALLGYLAATALPPMSAPAGVAARGTAVVVVIGTVLAATGFFRPAELRVLKRLRGGGRRAPAGPSETTEFAGEIIAADVPEPPRLERNEEAGAASRVIK